jgi:hypothetical protein
MPKDIPIVSNEEAAKADYVVCVRRGSQPEHFTDNLYDKCCKCGHEVMFRPYIPAGPKRLCTECFMEMY